ncbi:MAG: radical SAM protein, partial [Baekduiaceae bacterium]
MRWDHLSIDHDEAATLPGYREPAHVRRFDVPEAMDTRFYEVRAKSVLNRVPERSRMPFRWTINP